MERAMAIGAALSLCAAGLGVASEPPALTPVVLDNGVRLILLPSKGAARVGMEAVYSVGFIDEPEGMTQAAHLVEHLACMSATRTAAGAAAPGESWRWLSEHGTVNAETLGDFTHYDYEGPAENLPRFLEIERARLEGLEITAEVVAQEVPRVYAETDAVESNPTAPMFKHALMAANQSWRFGAHQALVRGGLLEIPIERLRAFHGGVYRPERLTLVICGGFDPGRALELAKASVGAVKPGGAPARRASIDWKSVPALATVAWDSKVSMVVLAFPPPNGESERVAVSLLGDLLYTRFAADDEVRRVSRAVLCTNQSWPARDFPVLVCATTKEGIAPGECVRVLEERVRTVAGQIPSAEISQVTAMAASVETFSAPSWESARAQGERIEWLGLSGAGDPAGLVLLNMALRGAMVDRLAGGNLALTRAVSGRPAPELLKALRDAVAPGAGKAVILEPAGN